MALSLREPQRGQVPARGPSGSRPPTSAPSDPEAEAPPLRHGGASLAQQGPAGTKEGGASGRPGLAKFLRVGDDLAQEGVSHGTGWRAQGGGVRVCPCPGPSAPSQGLPCTASPTRSSSRGWGCKPVLCPQDRVSPLQLDSGAGSFSVGGHPMHCVVLPVVASTDVPSGRIAPLRTPSLRLFLALKFSGRWGAEC